MGIATASLHRVAQPDSKRRTSETDKRLCGRGPGPLRRRRSHPLSLQRWHVLGVCVPFKPVVQLDDAPNRLNGRDGGIRLFHQDRPREADAAMCGDVHVDGAGVRNDTPEFRAYPVLELAGIGDRSPPAPGFGRETARSSFPGG